MKANRIKIYDGRKCSECGLEFDRGEVAAHLPDGGNICEPCWDIMVEGWNNNPANKDCPIEIE